MHWSNSPPIKAIGLAMIAAAIISAAEPKKLKPGEGVLCLGTIIFYVDHFGKICRPGQDPKDQEWTSEQRNRYDRYITKNVKRYYSGDISRITDEIDAIKANKVPKASFCTDDSMSELYNHIRKSDRRKMQQSIDAQLAKDGKPAYGDCV